MPIFNVTIPLSYLGASARCGALLMPPAAPMTHFRRCMRIMRAVPDEPGFVFGAQSAALFLKHMPGFAAAGLLAAPGKARTEPKP